MTDALIDLATIPGIDLSSDVACSVPTCGAPAVILGRYCCPVAIEHPWSPICQAHREEIVAKWRELEARYDGLLCGAHNELLPSPPVEWRPL